MKQAAWGIALAVAVVALALYSGGRGGNDEREAVAQCEGFADERLKAPASADYELEASESSDGWVVEGTVDSENAFGAKVRSDVRCELHFEGEVAHLDAIAID